MDLERERDARGAAYSSMPLPTVRKDSDSTSSDSKKKDPKTFSMTLFVNESEKNKIVDLLHKAKSLISRKVEKVMGRKPKSGCISNVDALQTVLETWMDREVEEEKEEKRLLEALVKEQEDQVMTIVNSGGSAPAAPHQDDVESDEAPSDDEDDDDTIEEEHETDLEVSRLYNPRHVPNVTISDTEALAGAAGVVGAGCSRAFSPVDSVPCPWGNRSDTELYPPKLRRPSSLYGAGAAAASSRPGSRLMTADTDSLTAAAASRPVSVSPSVNIINNNSCGAPESDSLTAESVQRNSRPDSVTAAAADSLTAENKSLRYARPDSFIIPIGGVWRPGDDLGQEPELRWGRVATDEEYLEQLRQEQLEAEQETRHGALQQEDEQEQLVEEAEVKDEGDEADGDPRECLPLTDIDQSQLTLHLELPPMRAQYQ